MRWVKYKPKQGDTREVIRFAWFPVEIKEGVVWLERYKERQTYEVWEGVHWKKHQCWITVSKDFYD